MKNYWLTFGETDPRSYTGLGPSFIQFFNQLGQTLAPPGITEIFVGSGAYTFNYSMGYSTSIYFLVDGGATLASNVRYIQGVLDPSDAIDKAVGYTGSSIGSTSVDPVDVMGLIKRRQEWEEGVQTFVKSSGVWNVYSRGASTLLNQKTLTNSTTGVTAI
jgi:hypothetical protein